MKHHPDTTLCDRIDGILVINLDSNTERYAAFTAAAAGWLPKERTERLSAVVGCELPGFGEEPWFTERTGKRSHAWAGAAGCALSHRRGIELAKERGWRNVLLLEDDAIPYVPKHAAKLLHAAIDKLKGAYMLYLGYNRPVPHGKRVMRCNGTELWQVDGVLATHAYLVSADAYDTLLAHLPTEENIWEWLARHRAIDTFYRNYIAGDSLLPVYAVYPTFFVQSAGSSDITGQATIDRDYDCKRPPYPIRGFRGILYNAAATIRRLKVHLNSAHTLRRARRGGFPGKKKSG